MSAGGEDFGMALGDLEQTQGRTGRLATAFFPADRGDNWDVQDGGEHRLAHLEAGTQAFDFTGTDRRRGLGQNGRAQGEFAPACHRIAHIFDTADEFLGVES